MNSTHALRLLTVAALGALMAGPALAQDDSYYFGGLSIGQSRSKIDEAVTTNSAIASGVSSASITDSNAHDTAYKLFGGYQFNAMWGVEAGYFNLGKFSFTSATAPAGTLAGEIKVQGFNLDLVDTMHITNNWAVIARIGAQYAKTTDSFSGTGAVVVPDGSPSKRQANYKFGAGMQYEFSPSMMLRGEAERYRVSDAVGNKGNVDMISVGLVFPFGRAPAPSRHAMAEPMPYEPPAAGPVAVEPAPAPAVVAAAPVAVAPVLKHVSYEAESMFSFDESAVRPEGKAALDTFAGELEGTQFETITVQGYADRLGSDEYNQTLSQQRADAVKSYLVTSGKVDPDKISAVGKSETAPVTKPDECKGDRPNPKLIACLQPDRRVEIEVTGTK